MENVSTIWENYGPYLKNKNNTIKSIEGHNTWIHTSFRLKI